MRVVSGQVGRGQTTEAQISSGTQTSQQLKSRLIFLYPVRQVTVGHSTPSQGGRGTQEGQHSPSRTTNLKPSPHPVLEVGELEQVTVLQSTLGWQTVHPHRSLISISVRRLHVTEGQVLVHSGGGMQTGQHRSGNLRRTLGLSQVTVGQLTPSQISTHLGQHSPVMALATVPVGQVRVGQALLQVGSAIFQKNKD